MSFFGKNIKKIRSIKGLSQQAFAELFDLKRGTLGAYEEGRSEPKIETIINVANYFSITIDDLLTSELTVNKLLRFKGDLAVDDTLVVGEQFAKVPCITEHNIKSYLDYFDKPQFISDLPHLSLPINNEKTFRAYTVTNLEMTNHDQGLYPKDVVVGELVPKSVYKKLNNGTIVLALVNDELVLRRLYISDKSVILRAEHKNIDDKIFDLKAVKELWRVRYVFFRRMPEFTDAVEDRLILLEQEFVKLRNKL